MTQCCRHADGSVCSHGLIDAASCPIADLHHAQLIRARVLQASEEKARRRARKAPRKAAAAVAGRTNPSRVARRRQTRSSRNMTIPGNITMDTMTNTDTTNLGNTTTKLDTEMATPPIPTLEARKGGWRAWALDPRATGLQPRGPAPSTAVAAVARLPAARREGRGRYRRASTGD